VNPVLLDLPVHRWECPACLLQDETREARPHTRMHACAGLGGLTVPMVPAGTSAVHRLVEREDYIGRESVQLHEGRPVMSVTTTRDDGEDCTVFAPTATAHGTV
jgi:hypothetical protein